MDELLQVVSKPVLTKDKNAWRAAITVYVNGEQQKILVDTDTTFRKRSAAMRKSYQMAEALIKESSDDANNRYLNYAKTIAK